MTEENLKTIVHDAKKISEDVLSILKHAEGKEDFEKARAKAKELIEVRNRIG